MASKSVREGGIKLFVKLEESGGLKKEIGQIRKVRDILDDFQGVIRKEEAYLAENKGKLFWDDAEGNIRYGTRTLSDGRFQTNELRTVRGWRESYEESQQARRYAVSGVDTPSNWLLKDELKQRMVAQARRAPYELPAAYVAQRAVTDKLFGTNSEDDNVNWFNPLDVISDFTIQSAKNAAFMFSPLEAAHGAGSHAFQKAMTLGDDVASMTRAQRRVYNHVGGLQRALQDVGHDAAKVTNKAIQYSSQGTGAFSTAIQVASENQVGVTEMLNWYRHGYKAATQQAQHQYVNKLDKWVSKAGQFLNYNQSLGKLPVNPMDALPGPFRGMASGVRAGAERWTELGAQHKALRDMHRMGRKAFLADPNTNKAALNQALQVGASPVEELLGSLNRFTNGAPVAIGNNINPAWKNGEFYQNRLSDAYNQRFRNELRNAGVDEADVGQLQKVLRVGLPSGDHESERFLLNHKKVQAKDPADLYDEIARRAGTKNSKALAAKIPEALRNADETFTDPKRMALFDRRTANEWNLFATESLPRLGETVLGKQKLTYQAFEDGNLDAAKRTFLARKTAEISGLNMRNSLGDAATAIDVNNHLAKLGFAPDNYGAMRAYLSRHKAITNPWNKTGANLFGFTSVGLEEATDKGFFVGSGPNAENEIRNLTKNMARRDPISRMAQYRAGGLVESAHGEMLDFNVMRRGVRRFTDKLANEFQIPLIHLPVLKTMGYSGFRNMREQSMIQYADGAGFQPFTGAKNNFDFYMWTRSSARGSKGNLAGFKWSDDSKLRETILPGKFRAISTSGSTLEAQQVKFAAGDIGRIPTTEYGDDGRPGKPSRLQKFKNMFNIDSHQPDSMFKFGRRFLDRKKDLNNPITFAKLLAGQEVNAGKQRLKIVGNEVHDIASGRQVYGAKALAEAFDAFPDNFRAKAMPRKLERAKAFMDDIFSVNLRDRGDLFDPQSPLHPDRVRLADIKSQPQLIDFARRLRDQDLQDVSALPEDVRRSMGRAQQLTIQRHLKNQAGAAYWDATVPGANGAISTRMDQFRADVQEYMIMRKGLLNNQSVDSTIQDMTLELSSLKSRGAISQAQYIEARSALLGTQLDFSNLSKFKRGASTMENTHAARREFQSLLGSKSLLGDVAQGQLDVMSGSGWQGRFGRVQPALKRRFGGAKYQYDGQEYDPFGGNSAFVPTFRTSFARNGWRAVGSVAGVNTWSDPESFSGSAIMSGHLIERVNKTFGLGGMTLDPTKYKGPLDMYARGMVGQRALPIVALGTTAVALDRTAGGMVNEKDQDGNRVYSPLVLGKLATGAAYAQAGISGLVPGGMSYEEKRKQIFEGEVPIRAGRWWPLGNTPFKGGRTQYYRPSWYRRLKSGYSYTDDTYGSPMERLAFGYDFSPLRPLDPYRFEREHYEDRPYPTSGEYFTGPWGPLTSVLNATAGRVLKPKINMHKDEVEAGLSQYLPTGQQGAYFAPPGTGGAQAYMGATGGSRGAMPGGGGSSGSSGFATAQSMMSAGNKKMALAGTVPLSTGRNMAFGDISEYNKGLSDQAGIPSNWSGMYGPVTNPGSMMPRVVGGSPPTNTRNLGYQARQLGYEVQELAGIYGFGAGALREKLGFGNLDMTTPRPVLESAGRAYGSTRGFWSLGLGGLGDIPSPLEGNLANIEISEIMRRFVPRERTGTQFTNPIRNKMGAKYPWLPSAETGYYQDYSRGDPYTKVPEGEMRLPGIGYKRLNQLHSDKSGEYGLVDQHKILGDVAPWSQEYRSLDRRIDSMGISAEGRERVEETRQQVADKAQEHHFKPYEHRYGVPTSASESIERGWEMFSHWDSPFHTKFMQNRTAVEDWERSNVYGSTFPQWQNPVKDFIEPMFHKSTQRNPLTAALVLGGTGSLFGKSAQGKVIGATVGAGLGLASSVIGHAQEFLSGKRYMPEYRREEVALEEYSDILEYTKNTHLAKQAAAMGDSFGATEYSKKASSTMYGVDVFNAPLNQIVQAVPKRKREHFEAMMYAPEQERDQILSTAGRLERRALQAVWGREVEARPDLEEYFQDHELPEASSSFWHPNTNSEQVKIKVGQSMGLDMSQMGYYPQQVVEANLVNPAYPQFKMSQSKGSVKQQLRQLMLDSGIDGSVSVTRTPYPGTNLQIDAGVY